MISKSIARQCNGAIERIWHTPMPPTNHHGADDEFAEDGKVAAQRGQVGRVSERKTDVAVCGNDFEEDGEDGKCLCGK